VTRTVSTRRGVIFIREANPANVMQFRELRLEALRNSPIEFGADYEKNVNQPPKYWEDMLTTQSDESTIFLAEHDSELMGMTGIRRGSSPKTRHSALIWGVYVQPQWRGLHIAEELINSCLTWAKARNMVIAKLGVGTVNQSAIRCYERCGFKTYGTEPRAGLYEGKYYDAYLMYYSLDNSSSSPFNKGVNLW
jgi:ribosomal protein S18 acetylase RimI-like enzyme